MARPRLELHDIFRKKLLSIDETFEEGHLYFRKPSRKILYPCIVYDLESNISFKADNCKYIKANRYSVTIIDEDPDSELKELIDELPFASLGRTYQADNLNHFVFTVYF